MAGPQQNRAPRRVVECACPRARHVHGTYACYKRCGCRCEPCTRACREYATELLIRRAAGAMPRFVPIGPVREHVEQLRAAGLGFKRIGALSGVPARMVQTIITGQRTDRDGPQRTVRADTAEKLLAVSPSRSLVAGRRLIDATGTRRRLQALAALGWSRARLAAHAGLQPSTIGRLMDAESCTIAAARTVHGLYEELWDQGPPAGTGRERQAKARAQADAARRGFVLPMAWDEEAIDDPAARPVAALEGRMTGGQRLDELAWLVEFGVPLEEAVWRVGYSRIDSARQVARRIGHPAAGLLLNQPGVAA